MKNEITLFVDGVTHYLVPDRLTDENNPCHHCSLKHFCAERMETIGDSDLLCDLISGAPNKFRFGILYEMMDFNKELDEYLFDHFAVDRKGAMVVRDNEGAHPNVHDLVGMATFFYQLGKQNKGAEL